MQGQNNMHKMHVLPDQHAPSCILKGGVQNKVWRLGKL
jgi:hypothetical protein